MATTHTAVTAPEADETASAGSECGPSEPEGLRGRRSLLGRVLSGLASVVVVALVVVAMSVTVVPLLVGGRTMTVLSGSMVPALPVGSMVVDRPVNPTSLRIGDVVTYASNDELSGAGIDVTHRIIGIKQTAAGPVFTTKGDANNVADDRPVSGSAIVGKVWFHVPYIGWARNVLLNRAGAIAVLGLGVLVVALAVLVRTMSPRRRDGRHRGPTRAGVVGRDTALKGN